MPSSRLPKIVRLVMLLAFVQFFLLAPSTFAAKLKDAIRVQMGGEPSTLDPWRAVDQYGFSIIHNVNEGLFKIDEDGKLQNGLAESYEVSKNNLIYTFKIRKLARWSDGKAVSAEDFVTGLRHALDPKTASPNAESFFAIEHAREVFRGNLNLSELGIKSSGESLVIKLSRPDPLLPMELSLPAASPLRADVYKAHHEVWSTDFPVTGDYTVFEYKPGDEIALAPNPFGHSPKAKNIIYKILTEEITAMNLFESGRLDIITTVTATEIDRLRRDGLIQIAPSTTVFYISFNVTKPPFNDVEWRRAVAASINRDELVKALNGAYEPITSYLPPSILGTLPYQPLRETSADKIKRKTSKPRPHFLYGSSAFGKTVAEKIQNDLAKKMGLEIEIEPAELKSLLGRLRTDPPEMYFLGMSANFDDPVSQLNSFTSATAPNFSRYVSPAYEKLVAELKQSGSTAGRRAVAEQANRILVEQDVVVIPIVLRLQVFGVSKRITGFRVNPFQTIQLSQLNRKLD